jgi:hypothetical protein
MSQTEFKLIDDPMELLAANNAGRVETTDAYARLLELDQVQPPTTPYEFRAVTLVPYGWSPPHRLPTQAQYNAAFNRKFPIIGGILQIPNISVCGGAAAWPLGDSNVEVGDIDLFVHGIDPTDMKSLCDTANLVMDAVRTAVMRRGPYRYIVEKLAPGVITLYPTSDASGRGSYGDEPDAAVQIILRAFPSVSSILYGFDIPSCCVAYDGVKTRMTPLAAYAHTTRVNIVNPEYRSASYEYRLLKYFGRGYAIAMPHMAPGIVPEGKLFEMPHITIGATVVIGNYMSGEFRVNKSHDVATSDYDVTSSPMAQHNTVERVTWSHIAHNRRCIASGSRGFILYGLTTRRSRTRAIILPAQQLAEMEPREPFLNDLRWKADNLVDVSGRININHLRTVFNMPDDEIVKFVTRVSRAVVRRGRNGVNVRPTLDKLVNDAIGKYDAAAAIPINWWITTDPSRQYTVSLNPRMEDPSEWYGTSVADAKYVMPDVDEKYDQIEHRAVPNEIVTVSNICVLCDVELDPISLGTTNLVCGHICHLEPNDACIGHIQWSEQSDTCIACNQLFVSERPPSLFPDVSQCRRSCEVTHI